MEGSPKDDVKDAPKEEPKDAPRDRPRDEKDYPPREERYSEPDRSRDRPRDDWGRDRYRDDGYRRPPAGPPMDIGAIFTPKMIGMMALVGVILLLIGALMATASIVTEYDDDADDRLKDAEDSRETYKNSLYITVFGLILIALPMLGGALLNDALDLKMRIGLVIGGSILIYSLVYVIAQGIQLMGVPLD
jgi:hypothetical protein